MQNGLLMISTMGFAAYTEAQRKTKNRLQNKKRKYMMEINRALKNKRLASLNGLSSADVTTLDETIRSCKIAVNEIDDKLGIRHTYESTSPYGY